MDRLATPDTFTDGRFDHKPANQDDYAVRTIRQAGGFVMRGFRFALSSLWLVLASSILLSGCHSSLPVRQAITADGIANVQWEIKRQIGVYNAWLSQNKAEEDKEQKKRAYLCGAGSINFDIASIDVSLTTAVENKSGPSVSGKTTGFVTFKPNWGNSTDATNTQELDYTLWPVDYSLPAKYAQAVTGSDLDHAPLAKALIDLRSGLIKGAQLPTLEKPTDVHEGGRGVPLAGKKIWAPVCFTDYNPDKPSDDPGYQFKLQVSFVDDTTYGFEIVVWLIDFSSTTENKSTTGNTITVNFAQTGVKDLQILADEVKKQCDFVNQDTDRKCVIATHAWHLVRYAADRQDAEAKAIDSELAILCKPAKPAAKPSDDCIRMTAISALAKKYQQLVGLGINEMQMIQ